MPDANVISNGMHVYYSKIFQCDIMAIIVMSLLQ